MDVDMSKEAMWEDRKREKTGGEVVKKRRSAGERCGGKKRADGD